MLEAGFRGVLLVSGTSIACSSEPDPRNCACAATAMPDGFYRSDQRISEVKRVSHDGVTALEFGFEYRFGMGLFSSSPLVGTLDGCQFAGTERFDTLSSTYEGVWSCELQRLEGTGLSRAPSVSVDFSFTYEPVEKPWYLGDGAYRLYGSTTRVIHPIGADYPGYKPADLAEPEQPDWELVGEAIDSTTFELSKAYPALMLTWPGAPAFGFDALTDETSGQSLSSAFDGSTVGFVAHANDRPEDLAGPDDSALFEGVDGRAGFVEVTFPDSEHAPEIDPTSGTAHLRVDVVRAP